MNGPLWNKYPLTLLKLFQKKSSLEQPFKNPLFLAQELEQNYPSRR